MPSLRTLLVSLLLAVPSLASAQQVTTITFTTVESYTATGGGFDVTGTPQGGAQGGTASLVIDRLVVDSCERMLMLMLEKPGRFTFKTESFFGTVNRCTITRVR